MARTLAIPALGAAVLLTGSLLAGAARADDDCLVPMTDWQPRSAVADLDIAAERKFLEYESRSGEQLHRRTFAQVLRAKHSGIGQLMKPVLAWDEVLKLIDRKGATPDRDAIKRDRELFLRIRNEWPHGMRTVGCAD